MNFNDYVLEAAEVNDISMMDVELTQTLAEMAVLEAMMDCYEKQMVLLEYNEDSADEIFTEAETFMPYMEDYRDDAASLRGAKMKQLKRDYYGPESGEKQDWLIYEVEQDGNKFVMGYPSKPDTHIKGTQCILGENIAEVENRINEFIKRSGNDPSAGSKLLRRWKGDIEKKIDARVNVVGPNNVQIATNKPSASFNGYDNHRKGEQRVQGPTPADRTNNIEKNTGEKYGYRTKPSATPATPASTGTPGPNATASSDKVNDQWNGDAAVSGPSKSFSNSFKKFMSKAGTAIQQLVLGLVDAIFEVNFEKLKEKVLDKGVDFEVKINKNEFDKLHRLTALIEVTNGYYEECSLDKLKSVTWTKAKVGAYVNTVKELEKALRDKFELVGAEDANDEGYAMNKDDFAELCDKLGHGEFKKKLRKCQKEVSAANIDYNVENQIPPVVGKELRKFVNYLIKAYQDTSKCFTKVLKFAEEVGAKAMERSKNGGVDYGTAKNAKRLEQRQKMLGKINDMGNFAGKVNDKITASRAQQAVPAWAEEGWSMNLEEDEDFF